MQSLQRVAHAVRSTTSSRTVGLFITALMLAVLPSSAMASEGDHIVLKFGRSQSYGLIVSLIIGVIALIYGLVILRGKVMSQSPGSEKMQEVGQAIRSGALAYLRKQITTMAVFIALLFCGLVALYWRMDPVTAFGIGGCFVAGVIASYVSGYAGMLMAVNGNTRTAHAALTSYRSSLTTAFRSGAVAGMVTVGIGLIGASSILLLFPGRATNLLVGFGFGASLAALFMRVGGGIFTKAADVGADLVGKVEAGIPEDDPRNPAVIADNVGDNVGDCAGMAADVFESYEVTLVASIVLGAATASIFDADTWPRLIVFGLAASALGLLASTIGVASVQGSDDPTSDPLTSLKKGFAVSAGLSFVLIGILAFLTMGGLPSFGPKIQTSVLISTIESQNERMAGVKAIQKRVAEKQHLDVWRVGADLVGADPDAKTYGFDLKQNPGDTQVISSILNSTPEDQPKAPDLKGLTKVTDFNDTSNKALDYSVRAQVQPGAPQAPGYKSLTDLFGAKGDDALEVVQIHQKLHIDAAPAQGRMPARAERDIDMKQWVGPIVKGEIDKDLDMGRKQLAQQKGIKGSVTVDGTYPVSLYTSPDGRVAAVVDGDIDQPYALSMQGVGPQFYKAPKETMETLASPQQAAPVAYPPQGSIAVATLRHQNVPWFLFWLTIGVGILMAYVIEFITDYYVSTHKAPTQEVAGVATAGAAPMVIQGFAHAATSSVFMVVAIVIALMCPLFLFNPATFGGYTLSFYGIALVGLGLLTTTAFVLAMDTFGPVSDNAQGVFEMSGEAEAHPEAAKVIGRLDAAGNTTKALTKGFAIATAVIAAVALFHSYLEGAHLGGIGLRLDVPEIFLGLLIGGAAPYLFSAFAINAVGRASFELINEVRRQFREDPGIMTRESKPDYARCVAIVTAAAQKELLAPGILAIALPVAVGFGFSIGKAPVQIGDQTFNLAGAEALGGFLAGAIVSGQLMAVLLANSGGMWDNAKKLIEDGLFGGKGSEAHKAAIVCDTIGDPFKDTAGPALNPLIKVMNLVALLISGVVIQPFGAPVLIAITAVCLVLLIGSIVMANRGSMSTALLEATHEAHEAELHFASAAPAAVTAPSPSGTPVAVAPTVEANLVEQPSTPPPAKKKLFVEEPDEEK